MTSLIFAMLGFDPKLLLAMHSEKAEHEAVLHKKTSYPWMVSAFTQAPSAVRNPWTPDLRSMGKSLDHP